MSARRGAQLADVNVLLALLWGRHVHHSEAQAWFAAYGHKGWATNAITQLGAIRLLTNSAITGGAIHASTALGVLAEATTHPAHHFWELDRPVAASLSACAEHLRGHRQWTDALLLQEAIRRGGKLVTFDTGLRSVAGNQAREHLLVLGG